MSAQHCDSCRLRRGSVNGRRGGSHVYQEKRSENGRVCCLAMHLNKYIIIDALDMIHKKPNKRAKNETEHCTVQVSSHTHSVENTH